NELPARVEKEPSMSTLPPPPAGAGGQLPPMIPVSRERPCPVCGKPDWCLVAEDGTAAICQRVGSGKRCGEAGWLHRLAEPARAPTGRKKRKPADAPKDWPAEAATHAANLTPARKRELAELLKLPADAPDALELLGFTPYGIKDAA